MQEGASKGLLEVIASSKDDNLPSTSLLTALGGKTVKEKTVVDDAFKLPDLRTPEDTKERKAELQEEKELLKPLDHKK